MSAMPVCGVRGTQKPPTPSTMTASVWARMFSKAVKIVAGLMCWSSNAAATCGAAASLNKYGAIKCEGKLTFASPLKSATSSFHSLPSRSSAPAATGFIPATFSPWLARLRIKAADTSVLPTLVSVPVTKKSSLLTITRSAQVCSRD